MWVAVWLSQGMVTVARPGDSGPLGVQEGQWKARRCPTLAGGAAVPRSDEWVAAVQRLTGPVAAGHEASQAGTQVAGLSGSWEFLAALVGLPQILTALQRGQREAGWGARRGERIAVTSSELAPGPSPRPQRPGLAGRECSVQAGERRIGELQGQSDWPKGQRSPLRPAK